MFMNKRKAVKGVEPTRVKSLVYQYERNEFHYVYSDELMAFDNFLRANSRPSGCINIHNAHGYLCAFAIQLPLITHIDPVILLTGLLGVESIGDIKSSEQTRQVETILVTLRKVVSNINYCLLLKDGHAFNYPFRGYASSAVLGIDYSCPDFSDEKSSSVVAWCRGFIELFKTIPENVEMILRTPYGRSLYVPIMYFGDAKGWNKKLEAEYGLARDRAALAHDLIPHLLGIRKYIHEQTRHHEEYERLVKKISTHWTLPAVLRKQLDATQTAHDLSCYLEPSFKRIRAKLGMK